MMREKHVWNLGRWRVAWRLGHYRTGFHRRMAGHIAFGLPFVWVSALRRDKAA